MTPRLAIRTLAGMAVSCLAAAAACAQTPARLVPVGSEIMFVSKQMGVPVEGRFKKFDANITLDPKKPESGKVALQIDVSSATLGVPEADAELPKPAWFHAATFPQATFQSSALKGLGGGKFEVTGKLNLKGNVRDLVVPVAITQQGGTSTATGTFTLKRLEYKIGDGEWVDTSLVANDVLVRFKLVLTGISAL